MDFNKMFNLEFNIVWKKYMASQHFSSKASLIDVTLKKLQF